MKQLIFINGTMGVGKTTISKALQSELEHSVFLDGDWCWDANPFVVSEETKEMVKDNIAYMLNNFLKCSEYQYVIFCWVMDEQEIMDDICSRLKQEYQFHGFSLLCDKTQLIHQLEQDIQRGIRKQDVIERSVAKMDHYLTLNTIKIDITNVTIDQIVERIKRKLID